MHFHCNQRDGFGRPVSLGTFRDGGTALHILECALLEAHSQDYVVHSDKDLNHARQVILEKNTPVGTIIRSHAVWGCTCLVGEHILQAAPPENN